LHDWAVHRKKYIERERVAKLFQNCGSQVRSEICLEEHEKYIKAPEVMSSRFFSISYWVIIEIDTL